MPKPINDISRLGLTKLIRDYSKDKDGDGVEAHEFMKMCPCFNAEVEYLEFQPKSFKPKSKKARDIKKDKK